jgi:hypothetical protein
MASGKSPQAQEEPKAIGYVDVYRGLTKEKVPLYK